MSLRSQLTFTMAEQTETESRSSSPTSVYTPSIPIDARYHLGSSSTPTDKLVFFSDIDNCLYPRSYQIHDKMKVLIRQYFMTEFGYDEEKARQLNETYYRNYGLALAGLVRHHQIDPMEYNRRVDDALPLEEVFERNPELRKLLQSIDRSKVRLWLFTNAYINHAKRVVKLLGVEDLFEGVTYCDYSSPELLCKPYRGMFEKAMKEAGVTDKSKCYFVDDSAANCAGAVAFGWEHTAHLIEEEDEWPENLACANTIRGLKELKTVFPEVFKEEKEE